MFGVSGNLCQHDNSIQSIITLEISNAELCKSRENPEAKDLMICNFLVFDNYVAANDIVQHLKEVQLTPWNGPGCMDSMHKSWEHIPVALEKGFVFKHRDNHW